MRWLLAPTALLLTIGVAAPAIARVSPGDVAATHAYLEADLRLHREATSEQDSLAALHALRDKVRAECPGVLAGAPKQSQGAAAEKAAAEVGEELLSATFGAGEHATARAAARFTRTVLRLHWSNPRLTRLLHELAVEQAEQAALEPPNLCADLQVWVASGYAVTSASTKHYVHEMTRISGIATISPEPGEKQGITLSTDKVVAHRLMRYETPRDRALAHRLFKETNLNDPRLRPYFQAIKEVSLALETPPTASAG